MEYLTSLIIILLISIGLLKNRKIEYKRILKVLILAFIVGVIWDTIAIYRGWWSFPDHYIFIGLIPLEDYLFMIIVPLFIIGIYEYFESGKNA